MTSQAHARAGAEDKAAVEGAERSKVQKRNARAAQIRAAMPPAPMGEDQIANQINRQLVAEGYY